MVNLKRFDVDGPIVSLSDDDIISHSPCSSNTAVHKLYLGIEYIAHMPDVEKRDAALMSRTNASVYITSKRIISCKLHTCRSKSV